MTAAEGFPCIDLYARPRKRQRQAERLNRLENLWVGGALAAALILEGVVVREYLTITGRAHTQAAAIGRLKQQKAGFEREMAASARMMEKQRTIQARLAARAGWLRLLQAVSAVTTDREALEQCTMDGRAQRTVIMSGSAADLTSLQALVQRLKDLACFRTVRLTETAADKNLGPNSVHFRIEARCDAAELDRETLAL